MPNYFEIGLVVLVILYQDCSNYIDPSKNMATGGVASLSYVNKGKTLEINGNDVVRETTLALVVIFIGGKSKYRVHSLDSG